MERSLERRTSPRTTPGALGSGLLIRDEEQRHAIPAKFLNISAGGALIGTDRAIAGARRVSLQICKVPELGWIDAEIVHSAGPTVVGVRFISPFRPEFVSAATSYHRPRRDVDPVSETL
jgi:hypothetical protein